MSGDFYVGNLREALSSILICIPQIVKLGDLRLFCVLRRIQTRRTVVDAEDSTRFSQLCQKRGTLGVVFVLPFDSTRGGWYQ